MPTLALCVKCNGVGQMSQDKRCKYCVGCYGPWYCSKQCQRADWMEGHKYVCHGRALTRCVKMLVSQRKELPEICGALILQFILRRKYFKSLFPKFHAIMGNNDSQSNNDGYQDTVNTTIQRGQALVLRIVSQFPDT